MNQHVSLNSHINLGPEDYEIDATEQNFEHVAIEESNKRLVLVDISADWCGPCNVLMPILDRLSKEYAGEFLLAKVDADENMRIAGRYKVRGFPTVIAFVNGEEVDRFHSAQRVPFVQEFIDKHLF